MDSLFEDEEKLLMKIVHIASVIDRMTEQFAGGRGRATYLLAKKQAKEGHDVTVISAPNSQIDGCLSVSFIDPPRMSGIYVLDWFHRRIKETIHAVKAYSWLETDYEIVHNHVEYEGVGFSFLTKTPCITTLHGPIYSGYGQIPTRLYALPTRSKFIAYSKQAYAQFKRIYGRDLIGQIYGGIDVEVFPFVSEPDRFCDFQFCYVGRIVPVKGVHIAIEVVDRLKEKGYNVHLKVLGSYSPTRYFYSILHEIEKRPYVSFEVDARTPEVARQLGNSDALLFPIRWEEVFGRVMIESMSCGTPIIAYNRGSTSEILRDGVTGFLCENINEMTEKMTRVHNLNRKECRKTVEKEFTMDVVYRNHLEIYKKVIDLN